MASDLRTRLQSDGYAVIPGLLDDTWVQRLKQESLRFTPSGHALDVQVQMVHKSATIREFVSTGPQLPIAIEVLGPNVCFTHQQYITKKPDEKTRTDVPWHQDNGYGQLDPPDDLTVWITLDDCDEANGCLWVIPGSHKRGLIPHHPVHGLMAAEVGEEGIPLPMRAGDAVIFGSLLLHRSLPNRTAKPRVAMYVRYCHPHVRMLTPEEKPVLADGFSWMVAGEA